MSLKYLHRVKTYQIYTSFVNLRVDLGFRSFHLEFGPVEACVEHALDGLLCVKDSRPSEYESYKLAELAESKLELLPHLKLEVSEVSPQRRWIN